MSIATYLSQTATIKHRALTGAADDYNQPAWTETTSSVPAYVEPISATEVGVVAIATHRAFLLPETIIDADDLVIVGGVTYEVVGVPGQEVHARLGNVHHIEVELVEVQD